MVKGKPGLARRWEHWSSHAGKPFPFSRLSFRGSKKTQPQTMSAINRAHPHLPWWLRHAQGEHPRQWNKRGLCSHDLKCGLSFGQPVSSSWALSLANLAPRLARNPPVSPCARSGAWLWAPSGLMPGAVLQTGSSASGAYSRTALLLIWPLLIKQLWSPLPFLFII